MKAGIRLRLILSYLVVVAVAGATVLLSVNVVAPSAFDAAMSHGGGMGGMDAMMSSLVRAAFGQALATALPIALVASSVVAIAAGVALSLRISRPIGEVARASRRIAAGRYDERVAVQSDDEVGELATAFNSMAASLEATERRRLELVGDVAHELRTPLATIESYLEGLEDGVVRPSDDAWHLLRGETDRLTRLVDDLQELWRVEAGQIGIEVARVDVADQLTAASARFAGLAREQELELVVGAPEPGLAVLADSVRLGQVIDNFVSNAIRYSARGGRILVAATREESNVVISVTDQGSGLTAEQQARVFERFYRVDPARSRAVGGSGIGLTIAHALVGAMGGRVSAYSAGPGRGSTFSVILPSA